MSRTVGAGFLALFASFGVVYSFGVFLPAIGREFSASAGATAGLFSATAFVFFGLGAVTGPLAERYGVRPLLVSAALLLGSGLLGTSLAPNLPVAYLTYGIGAGLGAGCVLVPMVGHVGSVAPPRRRALAVGIAVTGIGLGTVIGAPVAQSLIGALGWRAALQALAVSVVVLILLCSLLVVERPGSPAGGSPARYPREHALSPRFGLLWISTALAAIVLYAPFAVLPTQAASIGVGPDVAASLVGLIGLVSVLGRLMLGAVRRPATLLVAYAGAVATATIATVLWALAGGAVGLVVFAVLFGLGYGAVIALLPLVLPILFATDRQSSLLGLQYVASGVGAVLGPIGTAVLAEWAGSWTPPLLCLTAAGVVACAVLAAAVGATRSHAAVAVPTRPR